MLLLATVLACSGSKDSGEETIAPPTIEWLTPADGDTVTAGDVSCSTIIENFTLDDPAKHNTGAPIGYVSIGVDGTEAMQSGGTTFTLTLAAGAHELSAQLLYADGDEVLASDSALCDEDSTDSACAPVIATINVTAN